MGSNIAEKRWTREEQSRAPSNPSHSATSFPFSLSANSNLAVEAMLAPLRKYFSGEFRGKFRRYFDDLSC